MSTKSEMIATIAEHVGTTRQIVAAVLEAQADYAKIELKNSGEFMVPGLVKLKAKAIPARKTRVGMNPFTKEMQTFKSKPASIRVKSYAVKNVKDVFAK